MKSLSAADVIFTKWKDDIMLLNGIAQYPKRLNVTYSIQFVHTPKPVSHFCTIKIRTDRCIIIHFTLFLAVEGVYNVGAISYMSRPLLEIFNVHVLCDDIKIIMR